MPLKEGRALPRPICTLDALEHPSNFGFQAWQRSATSFTAEYERGVTNPFMVTGLFIFPNGI
jgi:hypothetical protein